MIRDSPGPALMAHTRLPGAAKGDFGRGRDQAADPGHFRLQPATAPIPLAPARAIASSSPPGECPLKRKPIAFCTRVFPRDPMARTRTIAQTAPI
ncbi:MAG: hypothetical protein IT542_12565 [Rubellimicrobium sp.]|nr:hypothetical protein [Rubellimicrobium sp.]